MKKEIILIAIIIGIISCTLVLKKYKTTKKTEEVIPKTLYVIQTGVYKDKNNVIKLSKTIDTFSIEQIDTLYHVYVAATTNKGNINLILQALNLDSNEIYIKEKELTDKSKIEKIVKFDEELIHTDDIKNRKDIIKRRINVYNENLKEVI